MVFMCYSKFTKFYLVIGNIFLPPMISWVFADDYFNTNILFGRWFILRGKGRQICFAKLENAASSDQLIDPYLLT